MLTREQTRLIDALSSSQLELHYMLVGEYDRDMSLPGAYFEQVRGHRDSLDRLNVRLLGGPSQPYRSISAVAPWVSVFVDYSRNLDSSIHRRIMRRHDPRSTPNSLEQRQIGFLRALAAVLAIPGMADAVARRLQERRRVREEQVMQPIGEYRWGRGRAEVVRVGEMSGPYQVAAIESGGVVHAVRLDTGVEVVFSLAEWARHRMDTRISEDVLRNLQANPVLQFGYGFAEGMGEGAQGTLELFANLRQVLERIPSMLSRLGETVRELAEQTIAAIMQWGRDFADADVPHRARMAGRVLGSIVFEICTEIITAGASAVASAFRRLLGGLGRARALSGVVRLATHVTDAARVTRRFASTVVSAAARRALQAARLIVANARRWLTMAYHIVDGVLEVAGELLAGTVRRVALAGEEVFLFVVEGAHRVVVNLGTAIRLPEGIVIHPGAMSIVAQGGTYSVTALLLAGEALKELWGSLLRRGLLREIPQEFSAYLVRRVNGSLSLAIARQALEAALIFRRRFSVMSGSQDTLQSLWEQQLRVARGTADIVELGARGQLDTIERFATHPRLRPRRMDLIPDGSAGDPPRGATPDCVVEYDEIPRHLVGMGRVERLEITTITSNTPGRTLAQRIESAVRTKASNGQLTAPLRVGGARIDGYGSIVVNVPANAGELTETVVNAVHVSLSRSEGFFFTQYPIQRYLVHQGDTWFEVWRDGMTSFRVDRLE
ncbi:MAG: hypothetical protein HOV80_26100 [Polyangiaceae bacterium]|nr:hypothetical protein [Polyangiaceae bacterium]